MLFKSIQATNAVEVRFPLKIALNDQSLWSLANINGSLKLAQAKTFIQLNPIKSEKELPIVSDLFVDDETDIDTERISRMGHGISSGTEIRARVLLSINVRER